MSGTNNFFSNSTSNQEKDNSVSVIYDSRRNNYTSPQENFTYRDSKKSSVDWDLQVEEVMKEEIVKLSRHIQDGHGSTFTTRQRCCSYLKEIKHRQRLNTTNTTTKTMTFSDILTSNKTTHFSPMPLFSLLPPSLPLCPYILTNGHILYYAILYLIQ